MRIRDEAGFTLVDLLFVIGIIGILAVIATPRMLAAQVSAGAASAIGSMRAISSAEVSFALTCGGGFYAPDLPTLGTAPVGSHEGFLPPGLGTATTVIRAGYAIQVDATPYDPAPASCNGLAAGAAGQAFRAVADPIAPGNTRYFGINANAVVYEDVATFSTTMPEVGAPPRGHPLR